MVLDSVSNHGLEYNALSYAWEDPEPTFDLLCSGKSLMVQGNLFDLLQQARTRYHEMLIWIDAICINQDDDAEKNLQNLLMGKIYSKAA